MNPTATASLTRELGGRSVPVAGSYKLDEGHTTVGFVARHLVVTKVRGRFEGFSADLKIADRIEDSSMAVTLQAASIATGNADRDAHLRSPDFFDVENFPQLIFHSNAVRSLSDTEWAVDGELEIKGVSKPLTLQVEFLGEQPDPWGGVRLAATATAEINREDWGLTWNVAVEAGGLLVSKKILIEIDVQAVPA